jgi:microsomal epoxide hydrolase
VTRIPSHCLRGGLCILVVRGSTYSRRGRIAEKFLIWTDDNLPIQTVLADVSVYWYTQCFSTAMWHYRASYGRPEDRDPDDLMTELREVPVGYSQFPKELFPSPAVWVKEKVNLVWHRRHDKVR